VPRYEEDGKTRWSRIVYVVDLDSTACRARRTACRGEGCRQLAVYVGETALTAEDRFAQHKAGTKASRWVKQFGLAVNLELSHGLPEFATVGESREAEAALGEKLRAAGYCVYGAH
jgi:hypothetical protein